VGQQQFIDHGAYLCQVEHSCRVRIKHGCVVNVLAVLFGDGGHHQFLYVDVGTHQRSQMNGQRTDAGGLYAVAINDAGQFNRATLRQVVYQAKVAHISVNYARLTADHRVDDLSAVFKRWRNAVQAIQQTNRVVQHARHDLNLGSLQFCQQRLRVLAAGHLQFAFDVGPGAFKNFAAAWVFI
jgi:hypothetical protein